MNRDRQATGRPRRQRSTLILAPKSVAEIVAGSHAGTQPRPQTPDRYGTNDSTEPPTRGRLQRFTCSPLLLVLVWSAILVTSEAAVGTPHDQIIVTVQGIVVEADFSYSKHGSTVQFTDRSTAICVAWLWYFGDGSGPVDEANPTHTYEKTGSFMVTLRVSDITGLIDEITKKVSIGSYDTKFFTAALGVIALVGGVLLTRGDERAQMASLVVIIVGIFIIVTLFMKQDLVSRVLGLGGF